MTTPDTLLGGLTPREFIATVWQQAPLLVRQALPGIEGIINGNDLAGIACEPDSDARLVQSDPAGQSWQCEHGPFKARRFKSLPASHWTLLVQSVDQWIPDIQALLEPFRFLPRWRVDDIMASYATEGGGVGPHFDYYDVFLIQASGQRRWQVGQACDDTSPLRPHPDLKLLETFQTGADYILAPGDMLYLPAGIAHWGTAASHDCITLSVGFRAPSHSEILQAAAEGIADTLPGVQRYRDVPAAIDSDPYCLNAAAIDQLVSLWQSLPPDAIRQGLARALGEFATSPRNPDHVVPGVIPAASGLDRQLAGPDGLALQHHPASRLAWCQRDAGGADLYVDGQTFETTPALARAICHGRVTAADCATAAEQALLLSLLTRGSVATR